MNTGKILSLAVAVVLVAVQEVEGLPGEYVTFSALQGKWLPPSAAVANHKASFDNCTQLCVKVCVCVCVKREEEKGVQR